ncbi:phage major capsid protein [Clostridioides difficile]|uniref:phage major capsid protein n=1 Tax=Clostridioides difficile TaxID=1496 RepID=UPI00188B505D|nr:phage major capsid protein [Clostridioides difficile]MBY2486246.1 phage major capsid protein [Clostridioides difficile]MDF3327429.1 phage major capsid protein [Clostridioides difficile]HBF8537288.1 phage major capsid protein [Clostridioides difficile]
MSAILSEKLTGLIPGEITTEIIKKVINGSFCLQNSRREGMTTESKTIPVMAEMPGPTWVGEGKEINVVEPTIVPVTLKAKKLGMIITASRETLEDTILDTFENLKDAIADSFYKVIDKAIIMGDTLEDGKVFTSIYEVASNQAISRSDKSLLDDLSDTMALVENNNYSVTNIIALNTLKNEIRKMKTKNDEYLIADTSDLFSTKVHYTSQLDKTKTNLITGDFNNLITGIYKDITYDVLREATLNLGGGKEINLAQQDMVAIRVTMRVASQILREDAFSLIKPAV